MSKIEKLILKILRGKSDANISFDDLRNLLLHFGFQERVRGSHHIFVKELVEELINLQSRWESGEAIPGQTGSPDPFKVRDGRLRLMHRYEIIIYWSEEDQVFVAEVPELPGCATHGDSGDQALANCHEAISLWIDTAREFGRTIPVPKGRRLQYA
jgi:predicted RNase H-like HicB family nuclease